MAIPNSQKVLITGASGFLGGHIAEVFVEGGFHVRAFVRETSKLTHLKGLNVEIARGDLRDEDSIRRAVLGMDVVVHAATTMSGSWEEYLESTIKGTERLLNASFDANVRRFVHISSISVYDISTWPRRREITEDTPYETKLLTNYSRSKIEAEKIVLQFHREHGLPIVVIRPGLLYGPRGKLELPRIGYSAGSDRYIVIGNGRNVLPVAYVRHVAFAILLAVQKDGAIGRVYNILDDEKITQKDYLKLVKSVVKPDLSIIYVPYFAARFVAWFTGMVGKILGVQSPIQKSHLIPCKRRFRYSNARAKDELRWTPTRLLPEAMETTLEWHKNARGPTAGTDARAPVDLKMAYKDSGLGVSLKAGIVGCGQIALTHIPILQKMRDAEVVALCDPNADVAADISKRFGISSASVHPSLEEMLEKQELDIVHILAPPQFHMELSILAMKRGCHVLVEKPMAVNSQESGKMVEVALRHNVRLCVGHNHLCDPVMIQARKLIAERQLGDIAYVESWYGFNLGANPENRYMSANAGEDWVFKLPGGLYQNLAPHPLSVLMDIVGHPQKIHAETINMGILPHMQSDELRAIIRGERSLGCLAISLAVTPRYQFLNIYGTQMTLFVDFLNKRLVQQRTRKGMPKAIARALMNMDHGTTILTSTARNTWKFLRKQFTPYDGTEILIREFYKSIVRGSDVPVPGEEGHQTVEIMDEIWSQIGPQGSLATELHRKNTDDGTRINTDETDFHRFR